MLYASDTRAKAFAQHGKGSEIDLSVSVCIGVMLFQIQVAFVVEQSIQYKGGVSFGTFDGRAIERGGNRSGGARLEVR